VTWSEKDKLRLREQYEAEFAKYGYDFRSLFTPKGRQPIRHAVLAGIGVGDGASVLDVGCGLGHMYEYLAGNYRDIRYTGVDIVPAFVQAAAQHHPGAEFKVMDLLKDPMEETYDFVFESGTFNLRLACGDNQAFVERMLRRMFELADVGVAADFLSTYVDFQHEAAFHYDPAAMFRFAKTLSRRVALRHDYMPFEFAIYIYKDDRVNDRSVFLAHQVKP